MAARPVFRPRGLFRSVWRDEFQPVAGSKCDGSRSIVQQVDLFVAFRLSKIEHLAKKLLLVFLAESIPRRLGHGIKRLVGSPYGFQVFLKTRRRDIDLGCDRDVSTRASYFVGPEVDRTARDRDQYRYRQEPFIDAEYIAAFG